MCLILAESFRRAGDDTHTAQYEGPLPEPFG